MESRIEREIKDIRRVRIYNKFDIDPNWEGMMTLKAITSRIEQYLRPNLDGSSIYVKIYSTGDIVNIYLGE